MRDRYADHAPWAPTPAPLGVDPRSWALTLQLAPCAASPRVQAETRHARFARQIEAAVLRDLATDRR
jgi:hypothetical protein